MKERQKFIIKIPKNRESNRIWEELLVNTLICSHISEKILGVNLSIEE